MKAALFSRFPLGDGINSLVLASLLQQNGYSVDTYHNTLGEMQHWFPHLPIVPYSDSLAPDALLAAYDLLLVVWDGKTDFILNLVRIAKEKAPHKIKVLYFYPSKHIIQEPYYADCLTDPSLSLRENYRLFAGRILGLEEKTSEFGWTIPQHLTFRKHPKRVVIHPTSGGSPLKSWPKEKFVALANELQKRGYEVSLIPGLQNLKMWEETGLPITECPTLHDLAAHLYESGYLIGNDSGPGHLASALGIPTLSLFIRQTQAKLWAPSFAPNIALAPYSFVPNVHGFRLRDRKWSWFVSVGRVLRGFQRLKAFS